MKKGASKACEQSVRFTSVSRLRAPSRSRSHSPLSPPSTCLSQALAGVTLGGIAYYSLTPAQPAPTAPGTDTSEASLTAALADTSGRAWGLNQGTPSPTRSSPAPPPPPSPGARSR